MLLVNVHKLDIVLANAVRIGTLKDQVHHVGRVLGFESKDVILLSGTEHLCERDEVDSERDIAVAAVGGEAFGFEHHGDESDMGVVHGLEGDAGIIAIEVAVLDEILDGVDDL